MKLDVSFSHRVAKRLIASKLVLARDVRARHRGGTQRGSGERWYYLSDRAAGRAIQVAAEAAGDERTKDRIRKAHEQLKQPGHAEHALARNDYLLSLLDDAERICERAGNEVVRVPREELWGESCPEYPLYGKRIQQDAAGEKVPAEHLAKWSPRYELVTPDGRFMVEWPDPLLDLSCAFDVEVEMAARIGTTGRKGTIQKIESRSRWWLRLLAVAEDQEREVLKVAYKAADAQERKYEVGELSKRGPQEKPTIEWWLGLDDEAAVPVIFFYPRGAQAERMRDRVAAELEAGRMPCFSEFSRRLRTAEKSAAVERLVLFAGYDDIRDGALGTRYFPLAANARKVKLRDAADMVNLLRIPKPPEWRQEVTEKGWDR